MAKADGAVLPTDVAQLIADPRAFAVRGKMEKTFQWIRANQPLALAQLDGYRPFWVASTYDDVLTVSRDIESFNSTKLPKLLGDEAGHAVIEELTGGRLNLFESLITLDEPMHKAHRSVFADWFLPATLKKLEPRLRELAVAAIEKMLARTTCNFATEVAEGYPMKVMAEILGIPEEAHWRFNELASMQFKSQDAEANTERRALDPRERIKVGMAKIQDACDYFQTLIDARIKRPTGDLTSVLANAEIDGAPFPPEYLHGHLIGFLTAGHHTSSATLASAVWMLCEHPEYLEKLRNEPKRTQAFVDETLRYITPAKHFMRGATKNTVIRDQQIEAGDWVYLSFLSANHDESHFVNPETFDTERSPNRHFAFGFGIHQCIGHVLARMEIRIFLEELVQRIDHIALTETPTLIEANFVQGPKTLLVEYGPRG